MKAYLRGYPEFFGETPVRDVGLIASEGRMTIPIEDGTPAGLLDIRHHYFEFIPEEQADREEPETVEATELVEGRNYFIVLTTAGGLYRYNISDLVRCVGYHGTTPLIEFLNKGAHYSSLAGEKLSEHQVIAAVQAAQRAAGSALRSYLLLPCWSEPPYYSLLVEEDDLDGPDAADRLAAAVEEELRRQNAEYANRQETRRLGPVRIVRIRRGSWAELQRRRLARSGGAWSNTSSPTSSPTSSRSPRFRWSSRWADGLSAPAGDGPVSTNSQPVDRITDVPWPSRLLCDGGAQMSTVSERSTSKSPAEPDKYRYGWRYVRIIRPDGTEGFDQVPLTLEDVLHPKVGDFIVQSDPHASDIVYLRDVSKARLRDDPKAVVLSDCRIDFNIPGVEPLGPDVAVFSGVRRQHPLVEPSTCVRKGPGRKLVVEVTSPDTRSNDVGIKMKLLPSRPGALVCDRRRRHREGRQAPDRR